MGCCIMGMMTTRVKMLRGALYKIIIFRLITHTTSSSSSHMAPQSLEWITITIKIKTKTLTITVHNQQ